MGAVDLATVEFELIDEMAGFELDPLGFVEFAFPWGQGELADHKGPREWQRKVLVRIGAMLRNGASLGEVIQYAISSGHGIGKSALVAWVILWALSTFEDTRIIVTANTEAQLTGKTWPEVAKWHRLSINSHWFKFEATSLFANDKAHQKTWRADLVPWSEHKSEAFAGLHNKGKRIVLVFDEASAIPDRIWEVAEGALTDEDTQILWLVFGNPTRSTGRFRECFRQFAHRWITENIDSRTVDGTNKVQIQKWIDDYGIDSDFVKVRVRGLFPSASFKQLISEADVDAAYGKHLRPPEYDWAPRIISCDPAWSGDDELVIGLRQGLAFSILATQPKNDNDVEVANVIARLEDEYRADAVFIDAGYGTGIVSVGKTNGRQWQLVWFGGKPSDPGCLNKRAEMWRDMRDWLKAGGAIPADPALREDLTSPETVPRTDGKIQLESKEDMKSRGAKSPNRADALAITFAFPVQPRGEAEAAARQDQQRAKTSYSPLDRNRASDEQQRATTSYNPLARR